MTSYYKITQIFLLGLFLFASHSFIYAQKRCLFTEHETHNKDRNKIHDKQEQYRLYETWLQKQMAEIEKEKLQSGRTEGDEELLVLPTVYHILHVGQPIGTVPNIPYTQIASQHRIVNEDLQRKNKDSVNIMPFFRARAASCGVELRLAEFDPLGNRLAELGVVRHNISAILAATGGDVTKLTSTYIDKELIPKLQFPTSKYLNQWIVPSLQLGDSDGYGYATFPNDTGLLGLTDDQGNKSASVCIHSAVGSNFSGEGVFELQPASSGGRTTTHELGHFFGLFHIWGDEPLCEEDDKCEDTPKQAKENQDDNRCTFFDRPSCEPNVPENFQNYMDYSDDRCTNMFTRGQAQRVRTSVLKGRNRKELLTSDAIKPHFNLTNLKGNRDGNDIILTWGGSSRNTSDAIIEKNTGAGFVEVAKVGGQATSFTLINMQEAATYRVIASNKAGKSAASNEISVDVVMSLGNDLLNRKITVYPNPANDVLNIKMELTTKVDKFVISDVQGRNVAEIIAPENYGTFAYSLPLQKLGAGLYLLQVHTAEGIGLKRIVKQ